MYGSHTEYIRRIEGHHKNASFINDDILEKNSHFTSITFYPNYKYLMSYEQSISVMREGKYV